VDGRIKGVKLNALLQGGYGRRKILCRVVKTAGPIYLIYRERSID